MFNLIFSIFMALACPAHHKCPQGQGTVTAAGTDTGGDQGHNPLPPPPPPPHPGGN